MVKEWAAEVCEWPVLMMDSLGVVVVVESGGAIAAAANSVILSPRVCMWHRRTRLLPATNFTLAPHRTTVKTSPLLHLFAVACSLIMMAMRPSYSSLYAFARTSAPQLCRASPAKHIPASAKRLFHTPQASHAVRPSRILSRARIPSAVRFESTAAPSTSTNAPDSRLAREQVPSYELTFTCNVCKTRSSHRLSKQGYHKGTVLISCPDCKNRHLISDHLKVRKMGV
jgi:hypothetical protein